MSPELTTIIIFYALMAVWSGRRFGYWFMHNDDGTRDEEAGASDLAAGYFFGIFWPFVWIVEAFEQAASRDGRTIWSRILMSEPKAQRAKRTARENSD